MRQKSEVMSLDELVIPYDPVHQDAPCRHQWASSLNAQLRSPPFSRIPGYSVSSFDEYGETNVGACLRGQLDNLGNSSEGMQRWKENFAEYQQRRRLKMSSSRRQSSGRRRDSESCCMRCRTFYTILVGSFFLSVLQGQSLKTIIAIYSPEDVITFDAIYHRVEENIRKFVPIQFTQSDSLSLSTFATLKHYEMSRVTGLALDK